MSRRPQDQCSARRRRCAAMEHALHKAGMIPFRQFAPFHVIHARYIVACNVLDPLNPFRAHLALDYNTRNYLAGAKFKPRYAWCRRAGGRANIYLDVESGLPLVALTEADYASAVASDPITLGIPDLPTPPVPDDLAIPEELPREWEERLLSLPKVTNERG